MNIRDLIAPDGVNLDLQARTPEEAMAELADLLVRAGVVTDRQAYLEAVRAREAQGTTAVGFGIAIPHGKSPAVARAGVAFGRSARGIDWPSLDNQPVRLVFLLAAPEAGDNLHLKMLSHLARMLMRPEVRERLLAATKAEEALAALE
ncbi:MAG: PTS sugar transporter subunit IIA [Firmicutes bacterium]|nr:PTS sugar transporter subunit IIA [Bacillota bacterium]